MTASFDQFIDENTTLPSWQYTGMTMTFLKRITPVLSKAVAAFHAPLVTAVTYDVSASGDGMSLSEALELAQPGATIYLAAGIYDEAVVSYRNGEVDDPITIEGSNDSIINGDYSSRCVLITHSFITLRVSPYTDLLFFKSMYSS